MDYAIQNLTDGERVVLSANLLDTSEFEIFRHAYQDWFGRSVDDKTLEGEFSCYLFLGQAPPWVRHYTRTLLHGQQPVHLPASPRAESGGLLGRILDTRVARFLFG